MRFLGYILIYSLIWLLYLMPERLLYVISDFLYLLAYYVVGYRKQVVFENLVKAFPDYDRKQIRSTAKRFYHHLCDMILEAAVSLFHTPEEFRQKISYINTGILNEFYEEGKQVIVVSGHYGNWEYLPTIGLISAYPAIGAYKPLKNPYLNRLSRQNRTHPNAEPIPMDQIVRRMMAYAREKKPMLTVFLADQRPMLHNIQYWTKFMGLDTPLYLGTEKLARKLNAAVLFLKIRKVRRGRYVAEFELITREPNTLPPFEITERHVRLLEKLIREDPAYWLWSHRRWKHTYENYLQQNGK